MTFYLVTGVLVFTIRTAGLIAWKRLRKHTAENRVYAVVETALVGIAAWIVAHQLCFGDLWISFLAGWGLATVFVLALKFKND